jgi:hypothetical protein
MSSYMGTQAQALGCGRNYKGVMGRADRMVLLLFATLFQFLVVAGWGVKGIWIDPLGIRIVPLEVAMIIMLIGGVLTTLTRGFETYRSLKESEEMESRELKERPLRRGGGRTGTGGDRTRPGRTR